MKKFLAVLLAVVMTASLSVVGLAEDVLFDSVTRCTFGDYSYDAIPLGASFTLTTEILEEAAPVSVALFSNDESIFTLGETSLNGKIATCTFTALAEGEASLSYRIASSDPKYSRMGGFGIIKVIKGAGTGDDGPIPASDNGGSSPTENSINESKTAEALASGQEVELKVSNGSSAVSLDTANLLGEGNGKLAVTNGEMTVIIPGGFGAVSEPGRIYYPLDFIEEPYCSNTVASLVKGENAKTEVVKAGGDMVMPTTVTVTLKTRLTGTVNVYYYNDYTGKCALLASPSAKEGKVTFATKQMGHLVLTTGTI